MKDYLHFEIKPPLSLSLLRVNYDLPSLGGKILVFYTKFYLKKSCVMLRQWICKCKQKMHFPRILRLWNIMFMGCQ